MKVKHHLNKIKNWFEKHFGRIINIDDHFSLILGYKGKQMFDASAFYCPYVPLTINLSNTKIVDMTTGKSFTMAELLKKHHDDNQ